MRQHAMGLAGPGERTGPFAWLEKIENGTLVNYMVAVRNRLGGPGRPHGAYGVGPPPPGAFDPEGFLDTGRVFEVCELSQKTFYCKDLEDVQKAIAIAAKAQEEIQALVRDGKFEGPHSVTA